MKEHRPMGSQVRASCSCGYIATFTIGGSMRSYLTQSYFPYRCKECGIISANIAEEEPTCPNDVSHSISRIGGSFAKRRAREKANSSRKKSRIGSFLQWLGVRKLNLESDSVELWPRCQWGDHEIYDEPYECPQCGQENLFFKNTGLRFD